VALGEQPVSYNMYLFSGDGRKVWVGGGREQLSVVSALGAVAYRPVGELDQVHRVIQELDVRMRQSMGPNCRLTLDAAQAQASAEARSVGAHSHTCLFEWIEVPDGMQQDPYHRPRTCLARCAKRRPTR
jgi:L-alanine-DL-glutamate epimerase-like enolase superfamily enzyme